MVNIEIILFYTKASCICNENFVSFQQKARLTAYLLHQNVCVCELLSCQCRKEKPGQRHWQNVLRNQRLEQRRDFALETINRICAQYGLFEKVKLGEINSLLPSAHKSARIEKNSILKLEGIIIRIRMSVATISR